MKIEGTEGIFQIPDAQKATDRLKDQDHGFQKIFDQTLNKDKPHSIAPPATPFLHPGAPVMNTEAVTADMPQTVDRVEQLIDMLDDYRYHLSEPSTSLKTLDSMVRKLEGHRESLVPVANELPEGDPLKTILSDSLVTASVEIFKFHRGDYLAP